MFALSFGDAHPCCWIFSWPPSATISWLCPYSRHSREHVPRMCGWSRLCVFLAVVFCAWCVFKKWPTRRLADPVFIFFGSYLPATYIELFPVVNLKLVMNLPLGTGSSIGRAIVKQQVDSLTAWNCTMIFYRTLHNHVHRYSPIICHNYWTIMPSHCHWPFEYLRYWVVYRSSSSLLTDSIKSWIHCVILHDFDDHDLDDHWSTSSIFK